MFRNFMRGRYGIDQLTIALLVMVLIVNIGMLFLADSILLRIMMILLLVICYMRVFSKNIFRRSQENARFLRCYDLWKERISLKRRRLREHQTYRFFRCPACGRNCGYRSEKERLPLLVPNADIASMEKRKRTATISKTTIEIAVLFT